MFLRIKGNDVAFLISSFLCCLQPYRVVQSEVYELISFKLCMVKDVADSDILILNPMPVW